jgi:hypothetical protein
MATVAVCAPTPKAKNVSDRISARAPAQTGAKTRLFEVIPGDIERLSDLSAGYKSRVRNFKPID